MWPRRTICQPVQVPASHLPILDPWPDYFVSENSSITNRSTASARAWRRHDTEQPAAFLFHPPGLNPVLLVLELTWPTRRAGAGRRRWVIPKQRQIAQGLPDSLGMELGRSDCIHACSHPKLGDEIFSLLVSEDGRERGVETDRQLVEPFIGCSGDRQPRNGIQGRRALQAAGEPRGRRRRDYRDRGRATCIRQ